VLGLRIQRDPSPGISADRNVKLRLFLPKSKARVDTEKKAALTQKNK
jgi:hypothetical protein